MFVPMLVALEASPALEGVKGSITQLTSDVTTLVPLAIGVGIIPFAAKWLFRKAKSLIS